MTWRESVLPERWGCAVSSEALTCTPAPGPQPETWGRLLGGKDKGDCRRYFEIMHVPVRGQQVQEETAFLSVEEKRQCVPEQ